MQRLFCVCAIFITFAVIFMTIYIGGMQNKKRVELLAPARNLQTAIAAIDYGADAVYIGAQRFGARYAAGNSTEDIAQAVRYARRYGVRVYATLNTILYEDELDNARQTALELVAAGVDALIFQDMAYLEMGIKGVEFHASTQVYNADPERVRFLRECGVSRVILERGLSLAQIREISWATDLELEAFVHGAICVCNSGRCYMSRSMGSRSGNRGECSQPCRLTYDLLDSSMRPVITGKHLLSVRDLDLSARIGDLLDAGVSSFKIEGRLKDLPYVKNTVNFYRRAIDAEISGRGGMERASAGVTLTGINPDLSKSFTRGRSEYFIDGVRAGVASFDTPKALGEQVGKIKNKGKGWIELDGDYGISAQDGLCFMSAGALAGTKVNRTEGPRIYTDKECGAEAGESVFRNYDYRFDRALASDRVRRVIDAEVKITLSAERVELRYTDEQGFSTCAVAEGRFEPAAAEGKMLDTLHEQATKSGDTIFRVCGVKISSEDGIRFVPVSALASLRRGALEKLLSARLAAPPVRQVLDLKDAGYPYVAKMAGPEENITNPLACRFYERHGVEDISQGLDMLATMHGKRVMQTPYCIRREIGECLLKNPALKGDLFLQRGSYIYALHFDCRKCMMSIECL